MRIWLNDASSGTLGLPDGRIAVVGPTGIQLSDGTSIAVGGKGYVDIGTDPSTTTLVLDPAAGSSTTARVSVASRQMGPQAQPSGTMTVFVNGTQYSQATLANGSANVFLPATLFTSPGDYTIRVQYSGDGNYSPSSSTQVFAAGSVSTTSLVMSPPSGSSTTAQVTVSGSGPTPTGTVNILINGVFYAAGTLTAGAVNVSLPTGAFGGTGFYTITANYLGDSTYGPSSNSQTFHFTAP